MQSNSVNGQPDIANITVVTDERQVIVPQAITSVVEVNNPGPQGPVGPQGPAGPSEPFVNIGNGVYATTSSLQVTGSFLVSGSSTFTNIGPAIFSGSVNATSGVTMSSALVSGDVTVLGTASINVLQINTTINSTGSNQLGDAPNDTQTLYGTVVVPTGSLTVSGNVSFGTSSAGFYWNNTNNRLGIGTSSPASALHVNGEIRVNAGQAVFLDVSNNIYVLGAGNQFRIYSGGTASLNIATNGNTLIGTTTDAGYKLNVRGEARISSSLTLDSQPIFRVENGFGANVIDVRGNGNFVLGGGSDLGLGTGLGVFTRYSLRVGSLSYADASAILQADSTTRGFLPPRTATTASISSPAQGLITYLTGSTNEGLYYYNSGSQVGWHRVLTNAGSQIITGSLTISGSTPSIQLGTSTFVGDFTNPAITLGSTSNGIYLDSSRINFKAGGVFAGSFSSDGYITNQIQIRGTLFNDLTTAMFIPYRLNAIGLLAGLGGDSTGAVTLITSGSARLYVSSSGNVGIGINTPTSKLEVDGDASFGKSTLGVTYNPLVIDDIVDPFNAAVSATRIYPKNLANKRLFFGSSTRTFQDIDFANVFSGITNLPATSIRDGLSLSWTGGGGTITNGAGIAMRFNSYWGYHFRNDSGIEIARLGYSTSDLKSTFVGPVAIGTTVSPLATLHISGSSGSALLRVDSPASSSILYVSGSGNVGIGTTAPSFKLDVANSTGVSQIGITSAANSLGDINFINSGYGLPRWTIRGQGAANGSSGVLVFQRLASTNVMSLTENMNVLIGTSTDSGYKLDVSGSAQFYKTTSDYIQLLQDANSITFSPNAASYLKYGANTILSMKSGGSNSTLVHGAGTAILAATSTGVSIRSNVDGTAATSMLQVRGSGATSATTALRIENSSATPSLVVLDNGFVGIGTGSAAYKFQVRDGDIALDFNRYLRGGFDNNWNLINLYNGSTGDLELFMFNTNWYLRHNANATFAGNVGVGLTTPSTKLHISGSSNSGLLEIDSPAVNNILYVSGSGNVGIGTASPSYILHTKKDQNTSTELAIENTTAGSLAASIFRFINNAGFGSVGMNSSIDTGVGSNRIYLYSGAGSNGISLRASQAAHNIRMYTGGDAAGNLRLSVESNGNVLIGTTTDSGYKLDVSGSTRINGTINMSGSLTDFNLIDYSGSAYNTRFRLRDWAWNLAAGVSLDSNNIYLNPTSGGEVRTGGNYTILASTATTIGGGYPSLTTRLTVQGIGATSATKTVNIKNSTPVDLLNILDNGQVSFTSPTMSLAASQSAFSISPIISASNVIGGQYYGVSITPTFFQTTGSQTETAFRVAATFTASNAAAATGGTNVIADFGSTSAGSQLTVTDVTSGSIYMVNDVSGIPIIEATSNWDVNIYDFPNKVFEKTGSQVNIYGTMRVSGSFILPLSQSVAPQTGSAYWSGSFLFIYDGTQYRSASFA